MLETETKKKFFSFSSVELTENLISRCGLFFKLSSFIALLLDIYAIWLIIEKKECFMCIGIKGFFHLLFIFALYIILGGFLFFYTIITIIFLVLNRNKINPQLKESFLRRLLILMFIYYIIFNPWIILYIF
jgi:hypothetical protein